MGGGAANSVELNHGSVPEEGTAVSSEGGVHKSLAAIVRAE